jgi:hypothetical protein
MLHDTTGLRGLPHQDPAFFMECHRTIISPPLSPAKERPKFPSSKKALYDRSFPRTSPIRKKRQSRLYIKLEVFDHTNYSPNGRFLGQSQEWLRR